MQLSIMAAMGQNRVIGNQGRLPWPPMPADWTHLHKVCQGKKMIMGRKSYDTPDRISSATGNVVISRQPNYPLEKGFIQANSLPQALAMLHDEVEVFVMGGEESGGLTIRGHVPEKDGILACLLMAEVRALEKKPFRQILKELQKEVIRMVRSCWHLMEIYTIMPPKNRTVS